MTPRSFIGGHGYRVVVFAQGTAAFAAAQQAHGVGKKRAVVTDPARVVGRVSDPANKSVSDITLMVPTLAQMAANFSAALSAQIAAGCPIVTAAIFRERWDKCESCRDDKGQRIFDPAGWGGRGKCRLCGCCAQLKLAWATAVCKRGLW